MGCELKKHAKSLIVPLNGSQDGVWPLLFPLLAAMNTERWTHRIHLKDYKTEALVEVVRTIY